MVRRRLFSRAAWLVLAMIGISVVGCSNVLDSVAEPTPTPTEAPEPTASPLPTIDIWPQATATAQATALTKPSGLIKNVTMALDAKDDSKDPVNPTKVFSPTAVFHAIVSHEDAPEGTLFKAVWYAVNVGAAAAPNTIINSFETEPDGSGNLDFTLSPKSAWPAGTYRIDIAVNGTVEQSVEFSVAGSIATPTVTVAPKPSGLISKVTMARDTQGEDREPVNPTTVFQGKSVFHAVVATKNAPKNTRFGAVWYVVDVGNDGPANAKIDSSELTAEGTRNIDFTLTPTDTWPAGSYRVDLLVNGVLDRSVTFSVK